VRALRKRISVGIAEDERSVVFPADSSRLEQIVMRAGPYSGRLLSRTRSRTFIGFHEDGKDVFKY